MATADEDEPWLATSTMNEIEETASSPAKPKEAQRRITSPPIPAEFAVIGQLFKDHELDKCIAQAEAALSDRRLSKYFYISTMAVLMYSTARWEAAGHGLDDESFWPESSPYSTDYVLVQMLKDWRKSLSKLPTPQEDIQPREPVVVTGKDFSWWARCLDKVKAKIQPRSPPPASTLPFAGGPPRDNRLAMAQIETKRAAIDLKRILITAQGPNLAAQVIH